MHVSVNENGCTYDGYEKSTGQFNHLQVHGSEGHECHEPSPKAIFMVINNIGELEGSPNHWYFNCMQNETPQRVFLLKRADLWFWPRKLVWTHRESTGCAITATLSFLAQSLKLQESTITINVFIVANAVSSWERTNSAPAMYYISRIPSSM